MNLDCGLSISNLWYSCLPVLSFYPTFVVRIFTDLTRPQICVSVIRWSPGIICTVVPTGPYSGGGEDKWISLYLPKSRWGLVKIEGEFHNRTTTPECSEDGTASVPSMVKTESDSFVCMCTQRVSMLALHAHTFGGLQSWLTKPTNTEYTYT